MPVITQSEEAVLPDNILERVTKIISTAREMVEGDGEELLPIAHVWRNGSCSLYATPFAEEDGDDGKNAVIKLLRNAVEGPGVDLFIYVMEAWFYSVPKAEGEEIMRNGQRVRVMPSKHPQKKEATLFMVETPVETYTGMGEIERVNGKKRIKEIKWISGGSGRFTGILNKNGRQP